MSITAHPFQPARSFHQMRRRISNILTLLLCTVFALAAVTMLLYLLWYVFQQGGRYINLDFFTQLPPVFGGTGGGMGEAVVGTLILVGLASLFGIPLGLFTGIYLSEFGRGRFADAVRFLVDVLTGLPTIIFGLFAWAYIVIPSHGFSALSGGVALGIIMIPIVARTSEEVLRLVPRELREASVALGASESRTILQVIIPAAKSGIITGMVLAMARIAGETAPLLMTAFGNPFWSTDITQPIDALPYRVYVFTESPYQVQINQALTGSFVLIMIVLIASFAVRWATGGFKRRF